MNNKIRKVTHPGSYINEWIEELEITQEEFALRLGISGKQLSLILNEEANVTTDIAYKLSNLLGTGPEIWLNLQMNYDLYKIRLKELENSNKEKRLYVSLDTNYVNFVNQLVNENEDFKNVTKTSAFNNLTKDDVYSFYSKKDRHITENEITYLNRNVWASISWREARFIKTDPFDEKKLRSYIPLFKQMTLQDPETFVPQLKELLRQCGVAFVLQYENKLANIKGLVKWLRNDKVMLTVATAQSEIGEFWVTFFHELNHVFKKQKRKAMGQYVAPVMEIVGEWEVSLLTEELLCPDIDKLNDLSETSLINYSNHVGVHPSIVIYYLKQKNKELPFNYKEKYYDIKVELTKVEFSL